MIIRKIAFHHILVFHGDQEVVLPTAKKGTLTVIVGPNNSGKTSVIRALKFWFYGENGIPRKSNLPLLLNNNAKSETEVGRELEGWVEVTFERETHEGKETLCLRRTLKGKRVGDVRWEITSISLRQILPGARLEHNERIERQWQSRLEGMMPPALFDAFYFKGEPLDGKLLGDISSIWQALGPFSTASSKRASR